MVIPNMPKSGFSERERASTGCKKLFFFIKLTIVHEVDGKRKHGRPKMKWRKQVEGNKLKET